MRIMKRQFTCSYANCQKTEVPIIMVIPGDPGERARYCCIDHAMMGTIRRAWIASFGPNTQKTDTLSSVESILKGAIGDGK